MARMLLIVGNITPDPGNNMKISGIGTVEGAEGGFEWMAEAAWGATATQINQAIEDAAVAAAGVAGYNITNNANDRISLAVAKAL